MRNKYDIKLFTYSKDDTTLAAEASTLRFPVGHFPTEFIIKNEKTGNSVTFRKAYDKVDDEGDLIYWMYYGMFDYETTIKCIIFND